MDECRQGWSGPGRQGSCGVVESDGSDARASGSGTGCDTGASAAGSTGWIQGSVSVVAGAVPGSARCCLRRNWRKHSNCWCWWVRICERASAQRSLHRALRRVSIGLTLSRAQCMPAPFSRASTTTLFPLSTAPLPMGHPCASPSTEACRHPTNPPASLLVTDTCGLC